MIHVAWTIFWEDCRSGQFSLIICQDPVVKGITTILNRSNTAVKLLLGSRKLPLSIIILYVVLECVFYELNDIRGSPKYNLTIRATTVVMLIYEVRCTNPKQNIIQPHISRSTGPFQYSVSAIIIDLDMVFSRFLFPIMQLITTYLYVVLVQYLQKLFVLSHMVI